MNLVIILLTLSLSGCFENSTNGDIEGYTGLENIVEAFKLAENDTNDLYLRSIQCSDHISNGYFSTITYTFFDIRYNNINEHYSYYASLRVVCKYNEEIKIIFDPVSIMGEFPNLNFGDPFARINYTSDLLDSDEAYEIAISDKESQELIKEGKQYPSFILANSGLTYNYDWYFTWNFDDRPTGEEGFAQIHVNIDAKTGKVLNSNMSNTYES